MENIKQRIRQFLQRSIRNVDIHNDSVIADLGIVHSLFMVQLVLFIEKEFGIEIDYDELDLANFRTVNDIAALISNKINSENGLQRKLS